MQGGACRPGNQGLCLGTKGTVGRPEDRPALSPGTCLVGLLTLGPSLQRTQPLRVGGGLCCEVWRSGGMPARAGRALGMGPAASLAVDGARGMHGLEGLNGHRAYRYLGARGGEHFTAVLLEASQTLLKPVSDHVTPLCKRLPRPPSPAHTVLPFSSKPFRPHPSRRLNLRAFHSTYLFFPHSGPPSRNAGCRLVCFIFLF